MAPTWLDVLDETVRVCAAHNRTDLVQRLQQKRAQLLDPQLRVLVVGEPKQGKSQLVNALINAPVCPVGDGPTTAIPTVVRHAETPTAALVAEPGRAPESAPLAEIAVRISTATDGMAGSHAEIGVPRGLLAAGLVLVDTPGADGDEPVRAANSVAAPTRADVAVLVTDATRELSVSEINLLLHLAQAHPRILVALTKIDISPHWRLVAERNRQHLASAGIAAPLLPVSSTLRLQAARANDKAINAESGFPELITWLKRALDTKQDDLAPATVGLLAGTVIEQLAAPVRTELSTKDASEQLARLYDTQRALDELRRCTTRWQNTLGDEMTDLMSDIEYDLRDRTRQLMRKVDEAFDAADPLRTWDEYQTWLEQSLTDVAESSFGWLLSRCDWISGRVADHFVRYEAAVVPEWRVNMPDLTRHVSAIEQPNIERFTPVQKVFTGLKGSYGGLLMFGLATTLAGMPLINPISLGAGALFGGKTIRDEGKSLLRRRQTMAKTATQRHVDDFFLRLNKECKDTARWVQRILRDHYTGVTEQLQDSIVQSLRTAKEAADVDVAQRNQRQLEAQQRMRRLAALYERAQALTGPSCQLGRAA
ncbi:dynamin family protein [Actinomycetes bacterium KLBMP 9797]